MVKFRIRKEKIESFIINRVKHYLENSDILKKMINDTNSMTNMAVPILSEQVSDLRKRLAENKKVIDGFSSFVRQSALTNPSQLDTVIRTITAERDKAELETMLLERELMNKENQLRELKSENQEKGMREYLEELLENFDSQKDQKKRDIIQLIIPKAIVHKDNKLEIWVRRDLGGKPSGNLTECDSHSPEDAPDFGRRSASYQPPVGMEREGFSECVEKTESEGHLAFSGLSHLEESGSSELKMAGRTGLEPAAFRVTGGRYNQLNYHPAWQSIQERTL